MSDALLPPVATGAGKVRDLRNRLTHHEAVWKFQEEDPVTSAPDYNRPVYGLQASLQLLRRAWKYMLEVINWLSPARHAAFLVEGHHLRFEALATHDGLLSFTGRAQLMHDLNVRRSKEIRKCFNAEVNEDIPADAIEITDETYHFLLNGQSRGKVTSSDTEGNPIKQNRSARAC